MLTDGLGVSTVVVFVTAAGRTSDGRVTATGGFVGTTVAAAAVVVVGITTPLGWRSVSVTSSILGMSVHLTSTPAVELTILAGRDQEVAVVVLTVVDVGNCCVPQENSEHPK